MFLYLQSSCAESFVECSRFKTCIRAHFHEFIARMFSNNIAFATFPAPKAQLSGKVCAMILSLASCAAFRRGRVRMLFSFCGRTFSFPCWSSSGSVVVSFCSSFCCWFSWHSNGYKCTIDR